MQPRAYLLTLSCLAALVAFPTHAVEVGVAACDITPNVVQHKVPMAGYGAREGKPSTGVHDPLRAKVLFLRDGATQMALVTTDLRSMSSQFKQQVLNKSGHLGFTAANVMLCASHTHDGPSFYPEKFWQLQFGEHDPAIVGAMTTAIAKALADAIANAAPAKIGFAETEIEGFTRNRRWEYDTEAREKAGETPATDPRLRVIRVDSLDNKPRAILVHFATHPTILGADNFLLSAEWPGVLQSNLESMFPAAVALFANGAEGDQAPAGAKGDMDFDRVTDFGTRLATHAQALARTINSTAEVSIAYTLTRTPLGTPSFSEAAKQGRYASWETFALEALPRTAELQQFRIGDVVLAGLPGEPICEVGRATESAVRDAGAKIVIPIGLANDYIGYILNAKEYAHGGYEVDSRSYYGPGLGDLIATESGKSARVLFANWQEPERIELFNGRDFSGWFKFAPKGDPEKVWSVENGVLKCTGTPSGYIRTTTEYENYRLSVEWRWPAAPGNNGVLVHVQGEDVVWPKSIEGQLQHENAGDFWVIGGAEFREHVDKSTRQVVRQKPHSEKPLGEWNQAVVLCDGDTIEMYVNGVLQNKATECTVTKGYIALQSEGAPIEYRNIVLEKLRP